MLYNIQKCNVAPPVMPDGRISRSPKSPLLVREREKVLNSFRVCSVFIIQFIFLNSRASKIQSRYNLNNKAAC